MTENQGQATEANLKDRDYTVIIDKSGSMQTNDTPAGSRWKGAFETTLGLAHKCAQFDPDGLTLYMFSTNFRRHENVKPEAVENVWKEHDPMGSTNLAAVLQDSLGNYFDRKGRGDTKPNGETICVITDGVPDNEGAVAKVIVDATKKMQDPKELGILFLQIGQDQGATEFLTRLDDDLQKEGAKFDIVDAKTTAQIGDTPLVQVLLDALND